MKRIGTLVMLSAFTLTAFGQKTLTAPVGSQVTLAAVSRDESLLRGGIGPSKWTRTGSIAEEPLALVTESGEWTSLPCTAKTPENCLKFERDYLSKPHVYTVVSADGKGATVHSNTTTLSECFDYSGIANYSGAAITHSAIAASSPAMFGASVPPRPVSNQKALAIRTLLEPEVAAKKLDSTNGIKVLSVKLEEKEFYIVQRAFGDASDRGKPRPDFRDRSGRTSPFSLPILETKYPGRG